MIPPRTIYTATDRLRQILGPPKANQSNPVMPGGARTIYADGPAKDWSKMRRTYTLERADFPRIPDRTWRHIEELRRQMTAVPYLLDEQVINRNLRLLVELLDDALKGVRA